MCLVECVGLCLRPNSVGFSLQAGSVVVVTHTIFASCAQRGSGTHTVWTLVCGWSSTARYEREGGCDLGWPLKTNPAKTGTVLHSPRGSRAGGGQGGCTHLICSNSCCVFFSRHTCTLTQAFCLARGALHSLCARRNSLGTSEEITKFGKRLGKNLARWGVLYLCSVLMVHGERGRPLWYSFSSVKLLNNDFVTAKLVTGSVPEDGCNKINNRKRSAYK